MNKKNINWRLNVLRTSLGILMLWFGFLKFFKISDPHAKDLAQQTVETITFGLLQGDSCVYLIAVLECIIGLGLVIKPLFRFVIPLIYIHISGTALPLLLFPSQTWVSTFVPTFEGQYIIKNMVLIAAVLVLSVTPKGGNLIEDGGIAQRASNEEGS